MKRDWHHIIVSAKTLKAIDVLHILVGLLSVALVVWITYDIFMRHPFMASRSYMTFQLVVCLVFLADFFIELYLSTNRQRYWCRRWVFLLISVPWLNLVAWFGISAHGHVLLILRFVPLARGVIALAYAAGYLARSRIGSLLAGYVTVLLLAVYIGSLVFFAIEAPINPAVTSWTEAVCWACLEMTTYGASVYPLTALGKVLAFALSAMGMVMFPLFTVYVASWVNNRLRVSPS